MTSADSNIAWLDRRLGSIKVEQALYLLLVALALASRFIMLGDRTQSHDESLHTRYSWELYDGQGYSHTPLTHGPFLFHATALSFWMFGDNDLTARAPVAALGVLLVALPYLLRRWLGRYGALAASAMVLISPSLLYYSRYIRHDIPAIVWSLILVLAIWSYLEKRSDKYIYWLAGALALMFATKEVAFLYVAIFGSFLLLRLTVGLLSVDWPKPAARKWFGSALVGFILGITILGVAVVGDGVADQAAGPAVVEPAAAQDASSSADAPGQLWKTIQVAGGSIAGLSLGAAIGTAIFGAEADLRRRGEFDLIVLFSTLLLPFLAPVPVALLGWDPLDYSPPGIARTAGVFLPMVALSAVFGLWWNRRRWLGAAGVFYAISVVLFTTVFTNGKGMATGWIGSLGYWLAQQEVQRGSQPIYFYLFVVPIYEYLPLIGALAAAAIWATRRKGLDLVARALGPSTVSEHERRQLFGFVPFLLWWSVMTWAVYSYSGERMGWLTVHFAVPMILLAGWAVGWLVRSVPWPDLVRRGGWAVTLSLPLVLAGIVYGFAPLFRGEIEWGSQELTGLIMFGRVVAGAMVAVGAGTVLARSIRRLPSSQLLKLVAAFALVSLGVLTVRTAWMASYLNYDSAKEFLVYAHGGAGTKLVIQQLEDISFRLYGDKSIRVAFDNDSSWPMWWYLRDYPNKVYFGENPSRDSLDVPVAIVGDKNWAKVEPYLADRFHEFEYSFVLWPMEDYKHMTLNRIWDAITNADMRAAVWDIMVNRDFERYAEVTGRDFSEAKWPLRHQMKFYVRKDVAAQMWDLGVGQSVADLDMEDPYLSSFQESLAAEPVVASQGSALGQVQSPRGVALGPDGYLYVADAGNHRIQVFSPDGTALRAWGSRCDVATASLDCVDPDGDGPLPLGAGQFNEPWGIAVAADGTVYVADTWNHRIQAFASGGEFLTTWGRLGQTGPGQTAGQFEFFYGPRDIAIAPSGLVYVSDTGNKLIQVFDEDGGYIGEFGGVGPLPEQLDEPVGIDFGPDGYLYVANTWNRRIEVFDQNHTHVRDWSVDAWYGQSINNKPYLEVDSGGRVFVTDPELYRVLVFDSDGVYQTGFGRYGAGADGLGLPIGVAVTDQGRVYISDAANNQILAYQLGD